MRSGAGSGAAAPSFSLAYDANSRPGRILDSSKPQTVGAQVTKAAAKNAKKRAAKKKAATGGGQGGEEEEQGEEEEPSTSGGAAAPQQQQQQQAAAVAAAAEVGARKACQCLLQNQDVAAWHDRCVHSSCGVTSHSSCSPLCPPSLTDESCITAH
jgi:hypothetical protein